MKRTLIVLSLIFSHAAFAAVVGVVDSGFYKEHDLLKTQVWSNTKEMKNRIDDDQNGYVDDLYGWNFADNSKFLFDITQVDDIPALTYKLMNIAAKLSAKIATDEEKDFIKKELIDLPEPLRSQRLEQLNFYGQYAHGTHVAGIVAKEDPNAELMNLRFFPTSASPYPVMTYGILDGIEDYAFSALAEVSNLIFDQVAAYVGEAQADVVNMSLGIPMERFAKWLLFLKGNTDPSLEELGVESTKIYKKFEERALTWAVVAPNTLFVVAAGNSGLDNDVIPAFPANVDNPNILSVAASIGISELPEFSNYGKTSVDVAAPGVDILSAAPGPNQDFQIGMTGTSMAAPYVAGVASRLVDANPSLTALDLKSLLMDTVDKKDWLADKVAAGGVINAERALYAAELTSKSNKSLKAAISEALVAVPDQVEETRFTKRNLRETLSSEEKAILKHLVF